MISSEFAKFETMRASVVCVPTCPHANVPKAGQLLIFTFQRANVPINMPTCQRPDNFSTSPAKRCTNLSTNFQKIFSIFEFFNHASHLQISRISEQF